MLFGKTPLKGQNDYIYKNFGGMTPLAPLATSMNGSRMVRYKKEPS